MLRLRIRAYAVILAAIGFMLSLGAGAEGSISLNAQIHLAGTLPTYADVFSVELVGQTVGAPMPAGSQGQVYRASRTGAGVLSLGPVVCERPGRWNYAIRQVSSGADCSYDRREYALQISAYNGQGGALDVSATLHLNGQEEKLEEICFLNTYPTQSQTGSMTPTGVQDRWMYYMGGAVALMLVALWLIGLLRREKDEE